MKQEEWHKTVQDIRAGILTEMGVKVEDRALFDEKLRYDDFHDVFYQYVDLFAQDEVDDQIIWLHDNMTFANFYAAYRLDQRIRNSFMEAVALFEQTFKTAMQVPLTVAIAHWQARQELSAEKEEFLQESYTFKNGDQIKRSDVKARIRHIKKHHDLPYEFYAADHGQKVIPYLLLKEMSFGVVLNYFFLLDNDVQKETLHEVFKTELSLAEFEQLAATLRLFNRRAAHNYRLLGFKTEDDYLYQKMINILKLLKNPEPLELVKHQIEKNSTEFLSKYPQDKEILVGLSI